MMAASGDGMYSWGRLSRGVEKALSLQSGTFGMLALSFTSCVTVANDLTSLPHFTHV